MNNQIKQTNYNYERSQSPSPQDIIMQRRQQQSRSQPNEYYFPLKDSYHYRICTHPIEEICSVTNNLEFLSPDFKYKMLKFICQERLNGSSIYGEYPTPQDAATAEQINGKSGYFLKKTTEAANIYLIWYNRNRKMYMFWGATEREVRDAINRIRKRILKMVLYCDDTPHTSRKNLSMLTEYRNIAESPPPPPPKQSLRSNQQEMWHDIENEDNEEREETEMDVKKVPCVTNQEKIFQYIMLANPGMSREKAEQMIDQMVKSVVVEHF